jgi:hypothetical protein
METTVTMQTKVPSAAMPRRGVPASQKPTAILFAVFTGILSLTATAFQRPSKADCDFRSLVY